MGRETKDRRPCCLWAPTSQLVSSAPPTKCRKNGEREANLSIKTAAGYLCILAPVERTWGGGSAGWETQGPQPHACARCFGEDRVGGSGRPCPWWVGGPRRGKAALPRVHPQFPALPMPLPTPVFSGLPVPLSLSLSILESTRRSASV